MLQLPLDYPDNALDISQDIVVPKAQHPVSGGDHRLIADPISFALGVLSAVDFDNETTVLAQKVGHISVDRDLSPELSSANLPFAQFRPQQAFRVRHRTAKAAGTGKLLGRQSDHRDLPQEVAPSPHPSPSRERVLLAVALYHA
jgi:hypothetical protein